MADSDSPAATCRQPQRTRGWPLENRRARLATPRRRGRTEDLLPLLVIEEWADHVVELPDGCEIGETNQFDSGLPCEARHVGRVAGSVQR
jgi:hypothetical protein